MVLTATEPLAGPRDFHDLTMDLRAAGLFKRRLGYYSVKVALTVAAFGAGWLAFFLVGDSWATLGIAVFLGVVATQLGFIGHDAGHKQIFESRRANRLLGLGIGNALIGLSYGWWVPKHGAHHAHPNEPGRRPRHRWRPPRRRHRRPRSRCAARHREMADTAGRHSCSSR